jgi:hypothetical protein
MTPSKTQAETTSGANQATQQAGANATGAQVGNNLSQFNGPTQSSGMYKSMLASGTQSTNQSYDNAARTMRMQAAASGVGGASGAVQGNNAAAGAQRAGALGQVANQAYQGTVNTQLQANSQQLQEQGIQQGAASNYNSAEEQAEIARMQQGGAMYGALLGAGSNLGSAVIGMNPGGVFGG